MKHLLIIAILFSMTACASIIGKEDYIEIGPQNLSVQVTSPKDMPLILNSEQITKPWGSIGLLRIKDLPNDRKVIEDKIEYMKKFAAAHGAQALLIRRYFDEEAATDKPVSLAAHLVRYFDQVSKEDKEKMDEFAQVAAMEKANE